VIDPWSTFFGGNEKDLATSVETDENGNVYVSGLTGSTAFPATDRPETPELTIHPNPAVNQTLVNFTLPQAEHVLLIVYDQRGREVTTLTEEWLPAGAYSVPFDGSGLPRARYYLRLFAGRETGTVMIVFQ
ncbi:MAG: SBBP repeat-containing protein, partial [Bacteroidetes bacterium]|nr:SBBP repeat-containing protein [Bacteroidota bacterium]